MTILSPTQLDFLFTLKKGESGFSSHVFYSNRRTIWKLENLGFIQKEPGHKAILTDKGRVYLDSL